MTPITPLAAVHTGAWSPCATCWGQRRIYEDLNGEGLVPLVCPGCLGVGDVVRVT
jgi:hypothetical protein